VQGQHPGADAAPQSCRRCAAVMPTLRLAAWHRGKVASVIKEFLAAGAAKRLHLERLPGYAPELNPQEGLWNLLKRRELKNLCCQSLSHLRSALIRAKERLRHRKKILQSCFLHALGRL